VDEVYRFDDDSYAHLGAAGIAWQDVIHVLNHARPRIRQHVGAVLRVAAVGRDGRWLAVALIEEDDDHYLVVGARHLDGDEAEATRKMIEGGA
jgi:hypothetical protein